MSSTNKTAQLLLSQFLGTDRPTFTGDYNADMAKIEAMYSKLSSGWFPLPACTYASAASFTLPGDWHTLLERGTKIKATQGTDKYFYVYPDATYSSATGLTTVTVTGGTDFTLANAAISSAYFSKSGNPAGFPDWINFSPSVPGFSGLVYTITAVSIARFRLIGHSCQIILSVVGTTSGSTSDQIAINLPVAASVASPNTPLAGYVTDGSMASASVWIDSTSQAKIRKYNDAQYSLATGIRLSVNGSYPI